MKISNYAKSIEPSLARALFNKAKNYDDVIDLTLGDPDFSTPERIVNAACTAIKDGNTHYSANAGLPEARIAVAKNIERCWGVKANPQTEILLTVGGMEALFLSLACLIDRGDEVIIFAPYYVNYVQMIRFFGGIPVVIDGYKQEQGFVVNEQDVKDKISDKTVAIIINSPNNPTGAIFDQNILSVIGKIAEENNIAIITDEVYRTLIFDKRKHKSVLSPEKKRDNIILIDSLSKEFSMTGWRIGYVFANEVLVQNMIKMQENVVACAPLPAQYALIEAYNNYSQNDEMITVLQERRDSLYKDISNIEGLTCIKPEGTFYMFVNIEKTGLSSLEFADKLLEQEHIAVVPGATYGQAYTNYIRIAFTKDKAVLSQAADKISRFVKSIL